jgi:zinc protease
MHVSKSAAAVLAAAVFATAGTAAEQRTAPIPIQYQKLDNGLRVVLVRDTTSPTAVVAVYYKIGFRVESPTCSST